MRALSQWPIDDRRQIIGVFTDIDDTLTTQGAITPDALAALAELKAAGLPVIAITGRPVGWSEPFARSWPVDAIVAENGAVALVQQRAQSPHPRPLPEGEGARQSASSDPLSPWERTGIRASTLLPLPLGEGGGEGLLKLYQQDITTRAANFTRMQHVAQRVLREVPGAMLAKDSPGRETDMAIDHSEFTYLPPDKIAQVVQILQSEGMCATVSSIHINGWFGAHNKLEGARWIARELLGRALDAEINRWVYVGDSTNDQLMFQHFPQSIGVANIRRFEAALTTKPRYITQDERGAGFAEVTHTLLTKD